MIDWNSFYLGAVSVGVGMLVLIVIIKFLER